MTASIAVPRPALPRAWTFISPGAKDVTILAGGKEVPIKIAEGTVEDALIYASVAYKPGDEISPSLDSEIQEGMSIQVVDVPGGVSDRDPRPLPSKRYIRIPTPCAKGLPKYPSRARMASVPSKPGDL